jgi:iron(III) transport system ATP-binding protein
VAANKAVSIETDRHMLQTLDRSGEGAVGGSRSPAHPTHLKIRNLSKRFGHFAALNSVSLDVLQGELVCFLGPSGCGKTTLLRAIAGLDIQSEGTIEIGGRDVSNLPPAERDFGIVFQSYALFPNLSIADNVGYGLVNRGWTRAKRRERVAELLTLVGLGDQGVKYPVQLSGGQQQRVALARALATSPSLLLLDEPLSALDARVRVRLREEIKMLQRRLGITTIMVTHDQEEALAMADRIVVMNHGIIDQVGTPAEVYGSPRTAFVADFVGTMTFLAGMMAAERKVRIAGVDLTCASDSGMPPGTAVRLGFRPEEVQVRGVDAATPNAMQAHVDDLEYLGAFCRATLALPAAPGLHLTADFSANAMRDLGIRQGQDITIALPPQALRVYPADSEVAA